MIKQLIEKTADQSLRPGLLQCRGSSISGRRYRRRRRTPGFGIRRRRGCNRNQQLVRAVKADLAFLQRRI